MHQRRRGRAQLVPGGGDGVQARIVSGGMRVPYMSLRESHLTEVHCECAE